MRNKPHPKAPDSKLIRHTVTLPPELSEFGNKRADDLEHAGNFSAYVRNLIIRDFESRKGKTIKSLAA